MDGNAATVTSSTEMFIHWRQALIINSLIFFNTVKQYNKSLCLIKFDPICLLFVYSLSLKSDTLVNLLGNTQLLFCHLYTSMLWIHFFFLDSGFSCKCYVTNYTYKLCTPTKTCSTDSPSRFCWLLILMWSTNTRSNASFRQSSIVWMK